MSTCTCPPFRSGEPTRPLCPFCQEAQERVPYSHIKITDETLPWKQPRQPAHTPYSPHDLESDGPDRVVTFIAAGARMCVTPTRETGIHSGRRRFQVRCLTCNVTVHKATTGTTGHVGRHLYEVHNWDGAPATLVVEAVDGVVETAQTDVSPSPATVIDAPTTKHHDFDPSVHFPTPSFIHEASEELTRLASEMVRNGIKIAPASIWVKTKSRPSWGEHHMMGAYHAALRGSCLRKRVGALIIDPNNRLVSGGFNGAASKQDDCLHVGCDIQLVNGRESCVRTLHAESNALDYAGRDARGCTLFTTVIPCRPCAMRIIQAGIDGVYYSEYYESQGTKATKALLEGAGVKLMHLVLPENELTIALRRAVGEIP